MKDDHKKIDTLRDTAQTPRRGFLKRFLSLTGSVVAGATAHTLGFCSLAPFGDTEVQGAFARAGCL